MAKRTNSYSSRSLGAECSSGRLCRAITPGVRLAANGTFPVGAQGMAQFMPATATWISQLYPQLRENKPYNPTWAIRALVQYDQHLWKNISAKNDCQRMAFTLSAYNGGQGWVNRDKKLAASKGLDATSWFGHVEQVNAGRSATNWRENRRYPKMILYQHAARYLLWGQASCLH